MARSPVYRFRINAEGLEDLKRDLAALGPAGEAAFDRLKQNAPQLANALQKAQDQAAQTRRELEQLGSSGSGVAEQITLAWGKFRGALAAVGIGIGARELVQFSVDGLRAVDALEDMGAALGISAQQFQLWSHAAIESDVELGKLDQGLERFNILIGNAAEGNKSAIETFQRLGVRILDGERNLRPFNDILLDTSDGLSGIEDRARRAAIEVELFGRKAATELDKLFGGGSGRIEDLFAAGDAAGIGPTAEDVRIANEATQALNRLAFAWENFRNSLALETGPALTATAGFLTDVARETDVVAIAVEQLHRVLSPATAAIEAYNNSIGALFEWAYDTPPIDPRTGEFVAAVPPHVRDGGTNAPFTIGSAAETEGVFDPEVTGDLDDTAESAREAKEALTELGQAAGALDTIIGKLASQDLSKEVKAWVELGDATQAYREKILQLEVEIEAGGLVEEDLVEGREELAETTELLVAAEDARVAALEAVRRAGEEEIRALQDRADEVEFNNQILQLEIAGTDEAREAIAFLTRERRLELIEAERAIVVRDRLAELAELEADATADNAAVIAQKRAELEQLNSLFDGLIGGAAVNESLTAAKAEMERRRDEMLLPFENFLEGVQDTFTDFWTDVYTGNVDSWSDAFDSIKSLGARFAAELTTLLTIRPVIDWVSNGLNGLLGGANPLSAGASTIGAGRSAGWPTAGGGGLGGIGQLFSGGGNLFGFANGIVNSIFGSSFGTSASALPSIAGAGGIPRPGGMLAPSFLNMGAAGNGLLGAGLTLATSLLSGQGIGKSLISAGFAGVGTAIGGPIGGMIGGLVGNLVGGLFGGKQESPRSTTAVGAYDGRLILGASNAKAGAEISATEPLTEKAVDAFNQILGELGGSISLRGGRNYPDVPVDFGLMMRGDKGNYSSFVYGEQSANVKGSSEAQAEAAFNDFIIRLFKEGAERGDITGLSDTVRTVLDNSIAKTAEDFAKDLDIAKLYDSLTDTETVTAAEQAIEALTDQFVTLRKEAARLGLDLGPVEEGFNKARRALTEEFNRTVSDAILGFEDPLTLVFVQLKRAQEEQRREAEALGADLVALEKLHALERERVVEQALQGSLAGIRDFVESALLGSLSTLSPEQKLFEAKRQYDTTAAAALAGDPAALQDFTGASTDYLSIARDFFASSVPYASIFDSVMSTAGKLGDAEGMVASAQARAAGLGADTFPYPTYSLPPAALPSSVANDTAAIVEDTSRRRMEQSERQHRELVDEVRGLGHRFDDLVRETRLAANDRRSGRT
jgi:hypothetical protein